MEHIHLGETDWLEREFGDTRLDDLLTDDGKALLDAAHWDEETRYDEGWQRAGGESFYRVGRDRDGTPAFIQKSGNPRTTLERGRILDDAGGVVIPTVILLDPDAGTERGSIHGDNYTILQDYVPETFTERYREDRVTEQAIEDLGRNAAALDVEGFRPTQPARQLSEMLSTGDHTYIVDFGGDIGSPSYGAGDDMYRACLDELDRDDHDAFQQGYRAVRDSLPD